MHLFNAQGEYSNTRINVPRPAEMTDLRKMLTLRFSAWAIVVMSDVKRDVISPEIVQKYTSTENGP